MRNTRSSNVETILFMFNLLYFLNDYDVKDTNTQLKEWCKDEKKKFNECRTGSTASIECI